MSSPPTTNAPRSGGLVGWIAGRVSDVGDATIGMITTVGDVAISEPPASIMSA